MPLGPFTYQMLGIDANTVDVFLFGADIDECKEKTRCQCPDCQCANLWGGYACQCANDLLYIREHDTCISESPLPLQIPLHLFEAQSNYGVHFIFALPLFGKFHLQA